MKPAYGLELVQTQKLVLTPELYQAIMILQMNAQELSDFILEETEKNPLLELVDEREEKLPDDAPEDEEDWMAYFCDSSDLGLGGGSSKASSTRSRDDYIFGRSSLLEADVSVRRYLQSQLGVLRLGVKERKLAEFIVESINDNGYLECTVKEIASATRSTSEQVTAMLKIIQGFDPPGVGARNLKECLELQAKSQNLGALALLVIRNHLDDLGQARYTKIAQDCRVSLKEVLRARDSILKLQPKPGSLFSGGPVTYITPDISVKLIGGEFVVILNDTSFPSIRWNPYYRKLLVGGESDARTYLVQQLKKARFLLKSIEQRRMTISKVMESIVRRQRRFFLEGPGHLEPMILQDIADELDIHGSTVSRAISGKYVDTPFGVFPCKMFFTTGVESQGREISQYNIKRLIEEMIDSEDPKAPLTDTQVAENLCLKGIQIARRTVAKYRSQLGIAPSNRRKKL